jgi:hypothetical protein
MAGASRILAESTVLPTGDISTAFGVASALALVSQRRIEWITDADRSLRF